VTKGYVVLEPQIVGRDRELAKLELAIGPGTDGLRFSMLSGPSGLGKTTLANRTSHGAASRGFRVMEVRGRAGSLSTPFAPLIAAMPELDAPLSLVATDPNVDLEHVSHDIVALLTELSEAQPLLFIVDDAQALDTASIAMLPYIAGISERANVTMLFIEQTDAVGVPSSYRAFVDGLLSRRVVDHLQLQPLPPEAIRTIVALELEANEDAVPPEIVERAQGNPWFAKELARAWGRGISDVPVNIASAATARLYSLEERLQELVLAIALCPEGAHVGWIEQLADERPRAFVRTMETINASGLVREDDDIVSISQPLMQQALIAEISNAMRRAIHLDLSVAVGKVQLDQVSSARALGYHLAQAGRIEDAVPHYLRAADANDLAGRRHSRLEDLVRASELEHRPTERIQVLKLLAKAAVQLGDYEHASGVWAQVARAAAAAHDDETYAYAIGQQYRTCNDGTSWERLERVTKLGADTVGWAAYAAGYIALVHHGDLESALRHDARAHEIAIERGDAELEVTALLAIAIAELRLGRVEPATVHFRQVMDLATRERFHHEYLAAAGTLAEALAAALRTEDALAVCVDALRYVEEFGLERDRPVTLADAAHAHGRVGKLEQARALITEAAHLESRYRDDHNAALVAMTHASLLNELGERTNIEAVIERAVAATEALGSDDWKVEAYFERARMLARTGSEDPALDQIEWIVLPTDPVYRATVAAWCARQSAITGSERARLIASGILENLDAEILADAPAAQLAFDDACATLDLLTTGDASALLAVVDRWAAAGRMLDALRARTVIALRVAEGDKQLGIVQLNEIRAAFAKVGAAYDADLVASRLRGLGTRSRAVSRDTSVGPLTRRELEIARLVASGMRNGEVASALFLAEKTVAAHLSNIYAKVEVRSRVQLTGWIRQHDPEFEASLADAN